MAKCQISEKYQKELQNEATHSIIIISSLNDTGKWSVCALTWRAKLDLQKWTILHFHQYPGDRLPFSATNKQQFIMKTLKEKPCKDFDMCKTFRVTEWKPHYIGNLWKTNSAEITTRLFSLQMSMICKWVLNVKVAILFTLCINKYRLNKARNPRRSILCMCISRHCLLVQQVWIRNVTQNTSSARA